MFSDDPLCHLLGLAVPGAPVAMLIVLGVSSLVWRPLSERAVGRLVSLSIVIGLCAALGMVGLMVARDTRHITVELGNWIAVPHYHFSLKFLFDRLSLPFVVLAFVLCGTIGAFAHRYLHRDTGFNRFFVCYALFVSGMAITALAGTIETLFAGWELVGLSSALLVAYFHHRPAPVRNGLRVWSVYRISDAALLLAAIGLHHLTGEGDFDRLFGAVSWPNGTASLEPSQATFIGLLLLVAAAGKSALVPFSGWLPRAMEGPTPSSAVFYGALSVHLGAFLLLRFSPVLMLSPVASGAVIAVGLTTAAFATIVGRAQTDIKSALSFASLTQVSIIVVEIGCGLRYLALLHILGHACLRSLQFLRAPTLLYDYHALENAIGADLPQRTSVWGRLWPYGVRMWFYRLAMERGYLDNLLQQYAARPLLKIFSVCDDWERRWTDWLSQSPGSKSLTSVASEEGESRL